MASEIALDLQIGIETQHKNVEITVRNQHRNLSMQIEKSLTPIPEYEGPYSVVPRFYYAKALNTKGKQMTRNVSVEPIPISEVSNPAGGRTITIGSV